jgi:membrane protein YqaA with SNARE-associated domain
MPRQSDPLSGPLPDAPTPVAEGAGEEDDLQIEPRKLALKVALVLTCLVVVGALLSHFLRDPMLAMGGSMVDRFGLWFVFVGVLFVDSSPMPLISEPFLFLGISGGLDVVQIGAVACVASMAAGWTGYGCGFLLGRLGLTRRVLGPATDRAERFVDRYGFWGIAAAALTPLPFAACTWTAGALRMDLPPFFLATLLRIPKTAIWLGFVHLGWSLGGG